MTGIVIAGFTPSFFVPGFFAETVYGAGQISAASAPIRLLVIGLKATSGGSITLDGTPRAVLSTTEANALLGTGSEAARMCYAALRQPGVTLFVACPTPAVGAVAATATITITSTPPHSATGEWRYRIAGVTLSGVVSTTATQNALATDIANAINGQTQLPVSAAALANVVTLTVKSAGVRGNQYILFQDTSLLPSSVTSAIAGGASVTGGGVKFINGAGTEDVSTLLDAISASEYGRIAFAENDTTNLPIIETWLYDQANWDVGSLQHGIVGVNGSLAAATTLATTTMNAERLQLLAQRNGESHPSELAACFGAIRSVDEQADPAKIYDSRVLPGIAAQTQDADRWTTAEQQSLLTNGVTPVTTNDNGDALVIRSITTKCLTSSIPDFRTLDTATAYVPDFVRRTAQLIWAFEFVVANPRVQDNPGQDQRLPVQGVAYPALWERRMNKMLSDLGTGVNNLIPSGLPVLIDYEANPCVAVYDPVAKRIMCIIPVITAPGQHQLGASIREQSSA